MSSSTLDPALKSYEPLFVDPPVEKKDWTWISQIIIAVVGAVIGAIGGMCLFEIFPSELLGGPFLAGAVLTVGGVILAPAAILLFEKWYDPPKDT